MRKFRKIGKLSVTVQVIILMTVVILPINIIAVAFSSQVHHAFLNKSVEIKDGDMKRICQPLDFFGLNCYNRVLDCADPAMITEKKKNGGGNYLDNGTEYYPRAVYEAIAMLKRDYQINIPIYITENGTYDCNEQILQGNQIHDEQRIKYLKGFLYWISRSIEEGADIRGYYVWSLLDNWEWSAGYEPRYGMVHVDYDTQQRILKDSAKWYGRVAGTKELEWGDPQ